MKKLFVALLALCLALGMTVALADTNEATPSEPAKCEHPWESLYPDIEFVFDRVEKTDSKGHTVYDKVYSLDVCGLCGEVVNRVFMDEYESNYEEHVYEENKDACDICGYKPSKQSSSSSSSKKKPSSKKSTASTVTSTLVVAEVEPAAQEMVSTLIDAINTLTGSETTADVEIVGAKEIFTEEEYTRLKALSAQEQILVTLSSIGMGDAVDAAIEALGVELSEDAAALIADVDARMAELSDEDRAALADVLAEYFPIESVTENGETFDYFVIELEVTMTDETVNTQRFGFRYDEAAAQWVFIEL